MPTADCPLPTSSSRQPPVSSLAQRVAVLREQLEQAAAAHRPPAAEVVSSGCRELDERLPGRGFPRGTLVEWLPTNQGSGCGLLALATARQACQENRPLVIVDRAGEFYAPAAVLAGFSVEHLLVVRPETVRDTLWALDQALRCPALGAVLCWSGQLSAKGVRRLQLSAEAGGSLGLLLRPADVRGEPCWAEVRLAVTALASVPPDESSPAESAGQRTSQRTEVAGQRTNPRAEPAGPRTSQRTLRVELVRMRGGAAGGTLDLEVNHETGAVYLASRVVAAASSWRATGA